MRRVIWPFVIWLLALALPAQGLAAATMLHCAPQRSETVPSAHAGHGHHGNAQAQHHHGAASDHHAADDDADDGGNLKTPLHKCSACATCCIGLGLPSSGQSMPGPLATATVRPEPASVHAAFLTSGPDRPPRAQRV